MTKKPSFIIGTNTYLKIQALREACEMRGFGDDIASVEVPSDQNEQPVGFNETYGGALTRATRAKECVKSNVVGVGIESGIFRSGDDDSSRTLDIAIVVLLLDKERQIVTSSVGIIFPEQYVLEAEKLGFKKTTVGSIITKKLNGDSQDPHFALTNGRLSRQKLLTDAIYAALIQI